LLIIYYVRNIKLTFICISLYKFHMNSYSLASLLHFIYETQITKITLKYFYYVPSHFSMSIYITFSLLWLHWLLSCNNFFHEKGDKQGYSKVNLSIMVIILWKYHCSNGANWNKKSFLNSGDAAEKILKIVIFLRKVKYHDNFFRTIHTFWVYAFYHRIWNIVQ
jgi:hypothetical protein